MKTKTKNPGVMTDTRKQEVIETQKRCQAAFEQELRDSFEAWWNTLRGRWIDQIKALCFEAYRAGYSKCTADNNP